MSFFVRVVFFLGIVYCMEMMVRASKESMLTVEEEKSNAPNKFSKTFGQEKRLDSIL